MCIFLLVQQTNSKRIMLKNDNRSNNNTIVIQGIWLFSPSCTLASSNAATSVTLMMQFICAKVSPKIKGKKIANSRYLLAVSRAA